VGWIDSHDATTRCDRFRLLGTLLLTQADTRALTLQFAVPVLRRIELQAAVLALDARIIGGTGGPGDNATGPDQSQKKDRRHGDVSHIAVLQLSVAGFTAEGS
jgi:hypothetical protein